MLRIWANSPVSESLSLILQSLFGPDRVACRQEEKPTADYRVLSYSEDFDYLWGFEADLLECLRPSQRTLVVVWDKIPPQEKFGLVNIADYLTAFDWALALSLTDVQRRQVEGADSAKTEQPSWRLIILDLTSERHGSSDTVRLFKRLQQNKPILPWISIYGPAQLNEFLWALQCKPEPHPEQSDLDLLRRLWISILTKPSNPGDRHAITNLIGPQILLSAMDAEPTKETNPSSTMLVALRNFMQSLGLVPSERDKEETPWVDPKEWRQLNPRFILLDDMHELGWADFLKRALGIPQEDDHRLAAFSRPDAKEFGPEKNKTLLELLQDDTGKLRIKQGLNLVLGNDVPILFLDLRLFVGRTLEEFILFENLLLLAHQAKDDGDNLANLPWRGFTSEEIQSIEASIKNRDCDTNGYYIALTLLPRLIALADPMLTIVLFSSTGQRRVIVTLKEYGNIITDFDKPRFFGEVSADTIGETRLRFAHAFDRALCILKGRAVYRKLMEQCDKPMSAQRKVKVSKETYVEIYIDEAREVSEQKFGVGGIAIIYPNEARANEFNRKLLDKGVVWGPTEMNPYPAKIALQKEGMVVRDYQSKILSPVDELLKSVEAFPLAFYLARPPEVPWGRDSLDLASPGCLDNLHRSLVLRALEVLLYEMIPMQIGRPRFSCGIYVAMRLRTHSDVDDPTAWDELPRRFGVYIIPASKGQPKFFRSLWSYSIYPMAGEVLALDTNGDIHVLAARGAMLPPYYRKPDNEELPRPAHPLADLVSRFRNREDALKHLPSLRKWLDDGFQSVSDGQFEVLLQASRHARAGRWIETLLAGHQAGKIEKWVEQRILDAAANLSGREFIEFCDRLAYSSRPPTASSQSV